MSGHSSEKSGSTPSSKSSSLDSAVAYLSEENQKPKFGSPAWIAKYRGKKPKKPCIGKKRMNRRKNPDLVRRVAMTPWGSPYSPQTRSKFRKWLAELKDGKVLLKKPDSPTWLKQLPFSFKRRIMAKLREVDKESWNKIRVWSWKKTGKRNRLKKFLPPEVKKEVDTLIVVEQKNHSPTVETNVIRYVDGEGIRGLVGLCLASGYTAVEVGKFINMTEHEIKTMVSMEDIQKARKRMPQAVIEAAEQKVMRDLLDGKVTEETSRADLIVSRRRKLMIDVSAERRALEREADDVEEAREKRLAERFGVNRKKGEIHDQKGD